MRGRDRVWRVHTSNFVGIENGAKKYVTPKSNSVLPSITNKSLMTIAADEGFTVEEREIPVAELKDFDEVIAVGTAITLLWEALQSLMKRGKPPSMSSEGGGR